MAATARWSPVMVVAYVLLIAATVAPSTRWGSTSPTGNATAAIAPRPASLACKLARWKLTISASSREYTPAAYAAATSPTL
ncbi:hypothetical protein BB31_42025 [Amycolatopsis lurida NRRL 2430]|uniref:Uncharacterized protein n=1 Tax=Amycolatopsis lurida NRRL 2430 TaxID=1460371 RepID=A0A2P2FF42_AMYLU|nr:hypothetical protein BB31_42025 [Amycolatopsis lurida NRRL 2430]